MRRSWLICGIMILSGCDGIMWPGMACTTEARPGLSVTVLDASTGLLLTGGSVIAREGAYADTARSFIPASYPLAYERPGKYDVSVDVPGFQLWSKSGVAVRRDGCHVVTVQLDARLISQK